MYANFVTASSVRASNTHLNVQGLYKTTRKSIKQMSCWTLTGNYW